MSLQYFMKHRAPRRDKYRWLLVSLLATFFAAPLLEGRWSHILFPLFLLVTLIFVIRSVQSHRLLTMIYTIIAALAYVILLGENLGWISHISIRYGLMAQVLFILYLGSAIYWIGKDIYAVSNITVDTIQGGISVYLLIGFVWALLYGTIGALDPNAFSVPMVVSNGAGTYQNAFHFSFTTLTTLGYGDIVPVSDVALVLTKLRSNCWADISNGIYCYFSKRLC